MKRGKFITFEGCDGCGKSTQLKLLSDYLAKENVPHIFTREPGGGKISEAIREILLNGKNAEMTDDCEALLYAAARMQHLADRVEPALAEGKLVVCDRYVDSSLAYQGAALGYDTVARLNLENKDIRRPDICIFLDLTPEKSLERIGGRGESKEIYENFDYLTRTRAMFFDVFEKLRQNGENIVVIDASGTVDEVAKAVLGAVENFS